LSESLPEGVEPTNLIYGEFKKPKAQASVSSGVDAFASLIEILKEIEKNTRKINQKLDKLIEKRQSTLYETTTDTEDSSSGWDWSSSDDDNDKKDDVGGSATDAFANMFG